MNKCEYEVLGLGMNNTGYPGAFTPPVVRAINSVVRGKVLHLYSGSSLIGDVRVDIMHENATINRKVEEFIKEDKRYWDWVLLDPPYALANRREIRGWGETHSLSADVKWRTEIEQFFVAHTSNVLWFDYCAPMLRGFGRRKLWFFLPGGFHIVRVLSWLEKEMADMFVGGSNER